MPYSIYIPHTISHHIIILPSMLILVTQWFQTWAGDAWAAHLGGSSLCDVNQSWKQLLLLWPSHWWIVTIFAIVSSRYSRIFCRRPQAHFTRHDSQETAPQNHGHSLFLLLDLAGSPTIVKQIRGKHVEHIIKFRQKPHQSYPTMARKMCCCDLPLEIPRNTKKFPWWTCIWTRRCIVPLYI